MRSFYDGGDGGDGDNDGGDDGYFNFSNAPPPNELSVVVNDYIFSIINVRKRDIEIQKFPFSNEMFLMLFIFPL